MRGASTRVMLRAPQHAGAQRRAGRKGIALQPPAYGINAVDRGLIHAWQASGQSDRLASIAASGQDPTQKQVLDEKKLLQDKFDTAPRDPAPAEPTPALNRTGIPDQLRASIEALSGVDMSGVRVHRNSAKPAQLNALALAQGADIHLGPGQERHLPHEAWHVVQQAQGRVKPTLQTQGTSINDDTALEHEADVMGRRALQKRSTAQVTTDLAQPESASSGEPAQMFQVGLVPTTAWRTGHITVDYGPVRVLGPHLDGGAHFGADINRVLNRNSAVMNWLAFTGAAPALPPLAADLVSDDDRSALISRANATLVAPEIDHIVPRASKGSNDMLNARVLSKGQNNAPGTARPTEGADEIRALWYEASDNNIGAVRGQPVTMNIINNLDNMFEFDISVMDYGFDANGEANSNLVTLVNDMQGLQY